MRNISNKRKNSIMQMLIIGTSGNSYNELLFFVKALLSPIKGEELIVRDQHSANSLL